MWKVIVVKALMEHGATKDEADFYLENVERTGKLSEGVVGHLHHILPRRCGWWSKYKNSPWNTVRVSWAYHISLHAILVSMFPENVKLLTALQYLTERGYQSGKAEKHKLEIINSYEQGKTPRWIAKQVGVRYGTTIARWLRIWGVKIRTMTEVKKWNPENPEEVVRLYNEGWSQRRLARKYRTTQVSVCRFLSGKGIAIRSSREARTWNPENPEEVIRLYGEGWTQKEIGERCGVSWGTVKNFLLRNGVSLRSLSEVHKWKPDNPREVIRFYTEEQWTPRRLAEKYNVSLPTVDAFLRRNGVRMRNPSEAAKLKKFNPKVYADPRFGAAVKAGIAAAKVKQQQAVKG